MPCRTSPRGSGGCCASASSPTAKSSTCTEDNGSEARNDHDGAREARLVHPIEGNPLRDGRARHVALRPAHARQHGAPLHLDHDGRLDRRADPSPVPLIAAPALCRPEYRDLETAHAAGERDLRPHLLAPAPHDTSTLRRHHVTETLL